MSMDIETSTIGETVESVEVAYLTKYAGKLDSGIAFTDYFYLRGLARSPLSTLVFANGLPREFRADGLQYTTQLFDYRLHDPVLHLVNGMGSSFELLRAGFFPEHRPGLKVSFIHDEPAAYDYYNTKIWNRQNVRDVLMRPYDGFIFVSSVCRDLWLEYGGVEDKLRFYLPNTCAEETLIRDEILPIAREEVRESFGMTDDAFHLVVVATVQPRKAQRCAVEAVAQLRRKQPDRPIRLHLVGRITQPHYGDEIRTLLAERGLEDVVTLVGEVAKIDALRYIYAADLLLLTSESEAMPLVLLEAMQLGTPIVTTSVGGIPEVVADDETAVFFEARQPEDLADKLERLTGDADRMDRLRVAARDRYWSSFSNERFFERYAAILRQLTQDRLQTVPRALRADGGFDARAGALTISGTPLPSVAGEPARFELDIDGPANGPRAPLRALLADLSSDAIIERARLQLPASTSLTAMLSAGHPLVRMGLEPSSLRLPERTLTLERERVRDRAPAITREEVFELTQGIGYQTALAAAAQSKANHSRAARELAKLKRTYRWKISNAIAKPVLQNKLYRKAQTTTRKAKAFFRNRKAARLSAMARPAVAAVFNSPMQMMAFLSLWDARYRDSVPPGTPLIALVYSTNGSKNFIKLLSSLCTRTDRFAEVVDITPEYASLYRGKLGFDRCVRFKNALLRRIRPFEVDTIFIAGFMSAKAQKLLYETFAESTIRLFEDGMGSYVPKRIKLVDRGIVDRVTSGDCAEAHHLRMIESVDLMLTTIPAPPQYGSDISRIEFPDLTVGEYQIDYHRFARTLGVETRGFGPKDALLLTQNFSDHLGKLGYTAALEREMNDAVIQDLLDRGHRVVIRPHPRATREFWSPRWSSHPNVEIWSDVSAYPVEILIDYDSPPACLVGLSSSCLFYLRDFRGLRVHRYPDARARALFDIANDEYKKMIDMARDALAPYPTHVDANVEAAES